MSQEEIPSYQIPTACEESEQTFSQQSNHDNQSISSISSSSDWSIDCSLQTDAALESQFSGYQTQESHYGPLQSTQAEPTQNHPSQPSDLSTTLCNSGYSDSIDTTATLYQAQPCQFWPDSQDHSFWGLSDSGPKFSDVSF